MPKDYDIAAALGRIEDELISSMFRNMKRHKDWETEEGFQWSMWQAEQLKSLEKYKQQNLKKYSKEFTKINQRIDALIQDARDAGDMEQEIEILEAIRNGFKVGKKPSPEASAEFFRLNTKKLEALIRATTNDFQKAEHAMLRMSNDQYRKIIFDAQMYANSGAATYEKAVDMASRDFLSRGINCIQYANGARHTIQDYADMAIRTASKRAKFTGEGEKRAEWGVHTVVMNKRGNPCPKCLPFCGKVLIDDVWSGGKKSDGPYPLMSDAIAAGLYHPRCKDGHATYFPNLDENPDSSFSSKEVSAVKEKYHKEQQRKYADRQVLKYRRLKKYSLDEENQKFYQRKEEHWAILRANMDDDLAEDNFPEPVLLGYADPEDENGIVALLEDWENKIVEQDTETAIIVTRTGNVFRIDGEKNSVNINALGADALKGAYMTHNHPSNETYYSFSSFDISEALKNEFCLLRGVDREYIYIYKTLPDTVKADSDTIFNEFGDTFYLQALQELVNEGLDADYHMYDRICKLLSRKYNFFYQRIKRG